MRDYLEEEAARQARPAVRARERQRQWRYAKLIISRFITSRDITNNLTLREVS